MEAIYSTSRTPKPTIYLDHSLPSFSQRYTREHFTTFLLYTLFSSYFVSLFYFQYTTRSLRSFDIRRMRSRLAFHLKKTANHSSSRDNRKKGWGSKFRTVKFYNGWRLVFENERTLKCKKTNITTVTKI